MPVYEKTWQFDTNRRYIPANVDQPRLLTITTTGGGTINAGRYFYSVTAIENGIESVIECELTIDTAANGTNTLTWSAVAGATAYNVWRGTGSLSYNRMVALGNVTTYTDTLASPGVVTTNIPIPLTSAVDLAKYTLWYWKAFLTGQIGGAVSGLWACAGSSDAVTGAMDGLDRWGATYDGTKIVVNSAGSAHSWFVLRSPTMAGQTWYILIDYSSSSFNVVILSLGVVSAPTGGSNTTSPTVTNAAPLASTYFSLNASISVTAVRFHGQLAADGSFNIFSGREGTRFFIQGFLCHLLANYRAGDLFPVWMGLNTDPTGTVGYNGNTGTSSQGIDALAQSVMRTPNNGGYDLYGIVIPQLTNWCVGEDAFDMSFADYPLWVAKKNTGQGFVGARGRIQDIVITAGFYGASSPLQSGSTDDRVAPNWTNIGNYRFPINTIPLWNA